jgi:hypothetical protein
MGADIVIAVDLIGCGGTFTSGPRSAVGIMIRSAMSLIRASSTEQRGRADLVIQPAIAHLRPDQIKKRDEFIALGEKAAAEMIVDIQQLIQ